MAKKKSLDPTEETSLLAQSQSGYSTTVLIDEEASVDAEVETNEFDNLLTKCQSHNSQIGIEPVVQENALLRGLTKSRRLSKASSFGRRRSATSIAEDDDAISQNVQDAEDTPFHAGMSSTRFWLIFSGILMMYFIACFDSTIMVSSHPIITSYFNSSNSASWLSTAFLLTSTAFQALFGRLSDTVGRRLPYLFCISVFLVATLWCGAAQSMLSFIFARALCGLGAGGMMTMGSIIVSDIVPIEVRGTYQSYINILFGTGATMGAAFGGAIADSLGWRWEFYIQVPAIGLCLVIALLTIPADLGLSKGAEQKSVVEAMKLFDFKGSILLTTSITFLILGISLGGNIYPWTHPYVIASLVVFLVAAPAFVYVERRVALPIMPLRLITSSPRANIILSNFFGATLINVIVFNIPLFFQAVMLESATDSGLRLMVHSVAGSSFGVATGFWITYSKLLKAPMAIGSVCTLAGSISLCFMRRGLPQWAYILLLFPTPMGQGFLFPSAFISILAVSEQAEQAVVTSTLILWRGMGVVLGVASGSLVLQNALQWFLDAYVDGPDKADIILEVRKSVRAIGQLDEPYRGQVIDAYEASLRTTFSLAVVLAVLGLLVVLPIKLPKLGQKK